MSFQTLLVATMLFSILSCASSKRPEVSSKSVRAGTSVSLYGKQMSLAKSKKPLKVGTNFYHYLALLGDVSKMKGKVLLVNTVPSVDTPVCEKQTHILGENPKISSQVYRVTVSRDLPMAQARFAKEAKLLNITYFSDYKDASFGKKTGLLINEKSLLARGVLVVDKAGIVQHLQIVDDVTQLPDMEKAISIANQLAK